VCHTWCMIVHRVTPWCALQVLWVATAPRAGLWPSQATGAPSLVLRRGARREPPSSPPLWRSCSVRRCCCYPGSIQSAPENWVAKVAEHIFFLRDPPCTHVYRCACFARQCVCAWFSAGGVGTLLSRCGHCGVWGDCWEAGSLTTRVALCARVSPCCK
jgi:hypothetical protein